MFVHSQSQWNTGSVPLDYEMFSTQEITHAEHVAPYTMVHNDISQYWSRNHKSCWIICALIVNVYASSVQSREGKGNWTITGGCASKCGSCQVWSSSPLEATTIQAEVRQPGRQRISTQTVRRRLHRAGLRSRRPAVVPDMNAGHERHRLAWCRHRRRWNRNQWGNVLFSDESRFCLQKNDGRVRVWRRRGERNARACVVPKKAHFGGGIMVWGGITAHGKTDLVIVDGNLNSRRYIDEILRPVVVPYVQNMRQGALFQDDNARPHRARIVDAYLQQEQITRMDWPACSPDLNPIEHAWDQLGRAVQTRLNVNSTRADLRRFLLEEWDRLPQNNIQRLIHSMRRRCAECIAAGGGPTHY